VSDRDDLFERPSKPGSMIELQRGAVVSRIRALSPFKMMLVMLRRGAGVDG
jgi:hypothetical protein